MPKKILREKLAKLIESDFSKATLNSTIKLFETHIDNECVEAVIEILKFVKSEKEIPNIFKRSARAKSTLYRKVQGR